MANLIHILISDNFLVHSIDPCKCLLVTRDDLRDLKAGCFLRDGN